MNRIFGSKWVDNTITPSDLLASALQAVVHSVNMSSTTSKEYIQTEHIT